MINGDRMEELIKLMSESKTRSEKFVQGVRGLDEKREMELMAAGYMCGFVDGSLLKK